MNSGRNICNDKTGYQSLVIETLSHHYDNVVAFLSDSPDFARLLDRSWDTNDADCINDAIYDVV